MTHPQLKPPDTLHVRLPISERSYPIFIRSDGLQQFGEWFLCFAPNPSRCLIVTDDHVAPLYLDIVRSELSQQGTLVESVILPAGEQNKTLARVEQLYTELQKHRFSRKDWIVALGGGVVGDIAGFCAATYLRGIPWAQAPTTLLAQVDSSVGGKVGVNFGTIKNAVGAFYQPNAVLIDPTTLATLPEREYRAGLGEAVKYTLIEQNCLPNSEPGGFFQWLCDAVDAINQRKPNVIAELIYRCCQMKAAVVTQDETDSSGIRAVLNLGHTFAHAYEQITNYNQLLHGEAVAIGLLRACQLAERLNMLSGEQTSQVAELMQQLNLVTKPPDIPEPTALIDLMRQDKKSDGRSLTFILPHQKLGQVTIKTGVSTNEVQSIMHQ